jgi:enterochelin esterase-like enzyme
MQQIADEVIKSGKARPMVIVMPNAGGPKTAETWNGYFNMPGWPYHDFFFQELLPEVEKKYNCGGTKQMRAIMGLSMGGGGSTVYAQRHTDMFCACYAMSPWLTDAEDTVRPGKNPDKVAMVKVAVTQNSALKFVETADDARKDSLRTVRWYLDCGDDDFLFDQSVRLHQLMRVRRIPGELRVRDGGHTWSYWQDALQTALPFAFPKK